jgi:hypothetical protein
LHPRATAAGRDALVRKPAGQTSGVSFTSVARILREWKLQLWRRETFEFSTDSELEVTSARRRSGI